MLQRIPRYTDDTVLIFSQSTLSCYFMKPRALITPITQELLAGAVSAFRLINGYRKLCLLQESAIANWRLLEILI